MSFNSIFTAHKHQINKINSPRTLLCLRVRLGELQHNIQFRRHHYSEDGVGLKLTSGDGRRRGFPTSGEPGGGRQEDNPAAIRRAALNSRVNYERANVMEKPSAGRPHYKQAIPEAGSCSFLTLIN